MPPGCAAASWPDRHISIGTRLVWAEDGSEIIEFAVCSSLLMTIVFGVLGSCLALYSYHFCAHIAREASRYASVRGSTASGTACSTTASFSCTASSGDVTKFVVGMTPLGFKAANLTVTTTWPGKTGSGSSCSAANGNNSPGCVVSVKVSYSFRYQMPFLPTTSLGLSSTSTRTIAR